MNIEARISAFIQLADKIKRLSNDELEDLYSRAEAENAWFTKENIERALFGISYQLDEDKLNQWLSKYQLEPEIPKIVGIVMAGNIPLVGFHDLLCVLISGHFAAIKASSQDSFLINKIISWLLEIEPGFKKSLELRERLTGIDAVIATGSDNTARYFEHYFKDIPSIIRKNRSSVAVLTGNETAQELKALGKDIFWYFGLGCRNISKLLVPKGYKPDFLFESIQEFEPVIHHHKYRNNYDYNKSIYLVNSEPHLDTGFLMWRKTEELVSPISVMYAQEYESTGEIQDILNAHKDKIQCVVGRDYIPFGKAQLPELWDYADKVDTLKFLAAL
ncbi:acyl-CoA reductase [Marinoscillum sp. MHG1-6]|uniref:acyl-CoA reductase n=1 Tax=Marinoscillum sp. MHG1-6 TaxID=2959627 RepID=UPI0021578C98|nr:acyl-CoA reductase [Marinoscillum sp. MHG1-6]